MKKSHPSHFCPFLSGRKKDALQGIQKLNEVTVLLVAVFVLLEFRNIPYGCSNKLLCLDGLSNAGGAASDDVYYATCGESRASCFETLVDDGSFKTYDDLPGFSSTYRLSNQFCYCLMKEKTQQETSVIGFANLTRSNVNLKDEPGPYCTTSIGAPLIALFTVGALVVTLGECVLPRRISALFVLFGAMLFYAVAFGILAGLRSQCPGRLYADNLYLLGWLCASTSMLAIVGVVYVFILARGRCTTCIAYDGKTDGQRSSMRYADNNSGNKDVIDL